MPLDLPTYEELARRYPFPTRERNGDANEASPALVQPGPQAPLPRAGEVPSSPRRRLSFQRNRNFMTGFTTW